MSGKILLVKFAPYEPNPLLIDPEHFELPEGLRASSFEDASALVMLRWSSELYVGIGGPGGGTMYTGATIFVMDKEAKTLLAAEMIQNQESLPEMVNIDALRAHNRRFESRVIERLQGLFRK